MNGGVYVHVCLYVSTVASVYLCVYMYLSTVSSMNLYVVVWLSEEPYSFLSLCEFIDALF